MPAGPLCERVAWPRRAWCALGGPACSLPQRARMHDCQTEAGRGVSWLRARNGTQAQSRNTGSARPPARRALRSMMFEYRSRTQMLKEGDQRSASTPRPTATDPCAPTRRSTCGKPVERVYRVIAAPAQTGRPSSGAASTLRISSILEDFCHPPFRVGRVVLLSSVTSGDQAVTVQHKKLCPTAL